MVYLQHLLLPRDIPQVHPSHWPTVNTRRVLGVTQVEILHRKSCQTDLLLLLFLALFFSCSLPRFLGFFPSDHKTVRGYEHIVKETIVRNKRANTLNTHLAYTHTVHTCYTYPLGNLLTTVKSKYCTTLLYSIYIDMNACMYVHGNLLINP